MRKKEGKRERREESKKKTQHDLCFKYDQTDKDEDVHPSIHKAYIFFACSFLFRGDRKKEG